MHKVSTIMNYYNQFYEICEIDRKGRQKKNRFVMSFKHRETDRKGRQKKDRFVGFVSHLG